MIKASEWVGKVVVKLSDYLSIYGTFQSKGIHNKKYINQIFRERRILTLF
jgi:hypothetical protein